MYDKDNKPHRSALRKGRVSSPDQAYFITKCTLVPGDKFLASSDCAQAVVDSLLWMRDNQWCRILGFVVMPDHYHMAIGLHSAKSLSELIASLDKYTASRINRSLGRRGAFWEEGFYDHAIRDRKDFNSILDYIHNNPVAAGLIDEPEGWPYSTANPKYASEIDWDWLGPSMPEIIYAEHRFSVNHLPNRYR